MDSIEECADRQVLVALRRYRQLGGIDAVSLAPLPDELPVCEAIAEAYAAGFRDATGASAIPCWRLDRESCRQ